MSGEGSFRDLAKGAPGQGELSLLLCVAPSLPDNLYSSIPWLHPCQVSFYFLYLPAALYLYFQQNSTKVHGGTYEL